MEPRLLALLGMTLLLACDPSPAEDQPDARESAAASDAAARDAAEADVFDAGLPDQDAPDAQAPDGGGQDAARPDAVDAGLLDADVAADAEEPDGLEAEAAAPDAAALNASVPDVAELDAADSDAAHPDVAEPDAVAPDVAAPDTSDPDVAVRDGSALDATDPADAEPHAADPDAVAPDVGDSADAEPDPADPDGAALDAADPADAEPHAADPDAADLDMAEPDVAEPDAGNADVAEPDAADPDVGQPDAVNRDVAPDAADPDAAEPDAVDPDMAPDSADPDVAEPEAAVPDAARPDAARPDAAASDAAEPDAEHDAADPDADLDTADPDAELDAADPDADPDIAEPDVAEPDAADPDAAAPDVPELDAAVDSETPDVGAPDGSAPGAIYEERFDAPEWPDPWVPVGSVLSATVEDGMGCLVPTLSNYSLARMFAPIDTQDVEVLFTLRFSDVAHQGVGFYVRANGGYLQQTEPRGEGYAVFVEGFRATPGIGVWREVDGHERQVRINFDPAFAFQDDVRYRVRFRVSRLGDGTDLRARIWVEGAPEPSVWHVADTDFTPGLQGVVGGLAIDSWNSWRDPGPADRGPTCVDDIVVRPVANPLDGVGLAEPIAEGYGFTEGPLWRPETADLLFSDIPGNTIHQYADGRTAPFIAPSGGANGLALDPTGALIVCEHDGRVVRYLAPDAEPEVLAADFDGVPFHSPNDVVVRSDGTVYFTDPPYGRPGFQPGPLDFVGIFRIDPEGQLEAAHRGPLEARYNGLGLAPDERTLYVSDTAAGALLAWSLDADGALFEPRVVADGLADPDGMAIDGGGRIYLATRNGVAVFGADEVLWGFIPIPQAAANCALGDGVLFVTARTAVYRVPLPE